MNIIFGITDVLTKVIKKSVRVGFCVFSVVSVIIIYAELFLEKTKELGMT